MIKLKIKSRSENTQTEIIIRDYQFDYDEKNNLLWLSEDIGIKLPKGSLSDVKISYGTVPGIIIIGDQIEYTIENTNKEELGRWINILQIHYLKSHITFDYKGSRFSISSKQYLEYEQKYKENTLNVEELKLYLFFREGIENPHRLNYGDSLVLVYGTAVEDIKSKLFQQKSIMDDIPYNEQTIYVDSSNFPDKETI